MALDDWEGLEHIEADSFLNEIRDDAEAAVLQAAQLFQSEWVKTLSGPRTGRVYLIGKTKRRHVASAPGEPPAVLYGTLRGSINYTMPEWDGWIVSSVIGTNVVYAARLEWGGIDARGVRILARPHAEPTALRVEPQIEQIFAMVAGSS